MKYLKSKNARRRGIAMEMAITVLLVLAAMSTITVVTTMIHVNKYDSIHNNFETQKIKYDLETVGGYYFNQVSNFVNREKTEVENDIETKASTYLINKYEEIGSRLIQAEVSGDNLVCTLTYSDESGILAILEIEVKVDGTTYTIKKWEYK